MALCHFSRTDSFIGKAENRKQKLEQEATEGTEGEQMDRDGHGSELAQFQAKVKELAGMAIERRALRALLEMEQARRSFKVCMGCFTIIDSRADRCRRCAAKLRGQSLCSRLGKG